MIRKIDVPKFIEEGIVKNHEGFPKRLKFWGGDTETVNGDPYTMQFHDGKTTDLLWVNRDNVMRKFLEYFEQRAWAGQTNVVYFHNLEFDLGVLMSKWHSLWIGNTSLKLHYRGWDLDIFVGKVNFAFLKHKASNKQVKLLDSKAFFTNVERAGLGALCEQLKLPVKKYPVPAGLGEKKLVSPEFLEYAKNDAVCEWHLASWIIDQYREYKTRICVSSPSFAVRVFRHYFLEKNDCIELPNPDICNASVLSYHGGKNGYYCNGVTVADNCYEVDIVSAYPFAMVSIPNFLSGEYATAKNYTDKYEGVWCVSGVVKDCKYPILFNHDFKKLSGKVEEVWVTSYELREALATKEITLTKCWGYVWKPDGKATRNPFGDYVKHFFEKKQNTPKDDNRYVLYKILLNSLYGKLIQTIDEKGVEADLDDFEPDFIVGKDGKTSENPQKKVYRAGGLYNPFIASLITGFVRAYLHRLEHKYKALHASTDSIKTLIRPAENEELGGITIQCFGRCYLFRNKLYLHYQQYRPEQIEKFKKKYAYALSDPKHYKFRECDDALNLLRRKCDAQVLEKFALHGFQGRPQQLIDCFKNKNKDYKINHMFKVREAYRQGKKALAMQVVDRSVDIDFSKVRYL